MSYMQYVVKLLTAWSPIKCTFHVFLRPWFYFVYIPQQLSNITETLVMADIKGFERGTLLSFSSGVTLTKLLVVATYRMYTSKWNVDHLACVLQTANDWNPLIILYRSFSFQCAYITLQKWHIQTLAIIYFQPFYVLCVTTGI